MRYIDIEISEKMIDYASSVANKIVVNRTKTSSIDTLAGALGELAFAQWFLDDWTNHDLTSTKGKIDFFDKIEIKTSAYPYSENLNLLVRSDYAKARSPDFYIQTILCVSDRKAHSIRQGTICRLSGWATHSEVMSAPLKDFGSKFGGRGGYQCHYIQIKQLHPMEMFPLRPTSSA